MTWAIRLARRTMCARDAEARWQLDGRRARRGRPHVLRGLHHDLRADLAGSAGRGGVWGEAGFAKLEFAITQGGFGKVRKATETPFNMVLEARPLDHRRPAERASRDRQRPGRSTVVVSIPCQRRMTSL